MPVTLYEDHRWPRLLPLVYLRGTFELFAGTQPLWERTERVAGGRVGLWCRDVLGELVAERTGRVTNDPAPPGTLLLNGRAWWRTIPPSPTPTAPTHAGGMPPAWVGVIHDQIACVRVDDALAGTLTPDVLLDESRAASALAGLPRVDVSGHVTLFDHPWNLVHANDALLRADWSDRAPGATVDGTVMPGSHLVNDAAVHIGRGTVVKPCVVIDATAGPVWIGERVTVQPHSYIEGPCYIGDGTLVQPAAVIHEGCSVGPVCKIGGELEASIFHGYSNKQHDGFLGHSVIGSFVNIAADVVASDLKNTYGRIRVPINGREVDSGEMFVGLTVGDHSKAGINVSFPTGAVVGFCSSVVGPAAPKFTPSFAWIDGGRWERYDAARGLAIAKTVMARRKLTMSAAEERAFLAVRTRALALEHASQLGLE